MRSKSICKGINQDGTNCENHSLKNSYYCCLHLDQATEKDIELMEKKKLLEVLTMFGIVIVLILVCMLTDLR